MSADSLPLWLRRAIYLVTVAAVAIGLGTGRLDASTAEGIGALVLALLAPSVALAHPTESRGRHAAK